MLTIEWHKRIECYKDRLKEMFYRPLGTLSMEGFITNEFLTPEKALKGQFKPMPIGTKWGKSWEYGWFRTKVRIPENATGKRIVLRINISEGQVFVNGKLAGGEDRVTLTHKAVPGETFDILTENWAGNHCDCGIGPVPYNKVLEPPDTERQTVKECTFGVWEEEAYQLWIDVETLWGVRENLNQDLLRVSKIDEGLRDFTAIIEMEQSQELLKETAIKCRARLKPLLDCVNGSTTPEMWAFGHSHLDIEWLWPLAQTERKAGTTFANQLALMEEYPEYIFLQSQPHLYWLVKKNYPEVYKRVKEMVRKGQFYPEGGMWVEADTNITGGESLIRQFLNGKKFFKEEFGVDNEMLWLPDVFGYSGALPQILRGCGIKYFSTAKIYWIYNGGDPFPYMTFTWEGIDGSTVLTHLCDDYNSETKTMAMVKRWNNRVQKDGVTSRMVPFGWGDGGGGATRDHLEFLKREKDLEGCPKMKIATPIAFFKAQEKEGIPDARYVGELYYQCHRGTYTSQARTKKGNRRSELLLRDAEFWSVVAHSKNKFTVPYDTFETNWRHVLLNQFHDIIPGSSINRVYKETEALYAEVIKSAQEVSEAGRATLVKNDGLTVFNSLSWQRIGLVNLPAGMKSALDSQGHELPVQEIDGAFVAEVNAPSMGMTSIKISDKHGKAPMNSGVTAKPAYLENNLMKISIGSKGEITSVIDKETGAEISSGVCNDLKMYKDVPTFFDAWDLESMATEMPIPMEEKAEIKMVSEGPLVGILEIRRKINKSVLTQRISLRKDSRRVDFQTTIDWQERHKVLKTRFPVTIHSEDALHEIQFGHIRRPAHKSRPFDADRFEVCAHKWSALVEENRGCAVLNDSKYGVSTDRNSINLTLLRAPTAPDAKADLGFQGFTYSFLYWKGPFISSDVVHQAYDLNVPLTVIKGNSETVEFLSLDAPNIIIEAVKPADDRSEDFIVRMYESKRSLTSTVLHVGLPFSEVWETDMLEQKVRKLDSDKAQIKLAFRPFEIKTVRLVRK